MEEQSIITKPWTSEVISDRSLIMCLSLGPRLRQHHSHHQKPSVERHWAASGGKPNREKHQWLSALLSVREGMCGTKQKHSAPDHELTPLCSWNMGPSSPGSTTHQLFLLNPSPLTDTCQRTGWSVQWNLYCKVSYSALVSSTQLPKLIPNSSRKLWNSR